MNLLSDYTKEIEFPLIKNSQINFLDSGGILHVKNYWGGKYFLSLLTKDNYLDKKIYEDILLKRKVKKDINSIKQLSILTNKLKSLVHNHVFAMSMMPLVKSIGCKLEKTHIDLGVIRFHLLNNLRQKAESSGFFLKSDFVRMKKKAIPEVFGYDKLPPHRDVRWKHIRILGLWMPLTDLEPKETLTLFPEVFNKNIATGDPSKIPYPKINKIEDFKLGEIYTPKMQAGDLLIFHAATVHSSPLLQKKPFRGSIDFRVAYPCLDDFKHYKSTFVSAKNFISFNNKSNKIDKNIHKKTIYNFVKTIKTNFKMHDSPSSIWEINKLANKNKAQNLSLNFIRLIRTNILCEDSTFNLIQIIKNKDQIFFLLKLILFKSNSYFWLFEGLKQSKKKKFLFLKILFVLKTLIISSLTKLKIVDIPINWPENARELSPREVIKNVILGKY